MCMRSICAELDAWATHMESRIERKTPPIVQSVNVIARAMNACVPTALEREGPGPRRHWELYGHRAQALSSSKSPRRALLRITFDLTLARPDMSLRDRPG